MKTVLTIAGSDCGGAGGIQSDIKTITAHRLYATSAITAMTAQNTTGVYDIQESTTKFLGRQLDCIFEDIYPDAVKIGMVSNEELIEVIADKLKQYKAANIVLDTSIVSSSGRRMVGNKSTSLLRARRRFSEAESLSGIKIDSIEDMGAAAGIISQKYGVKGIFFREGHKITEKGDMLFDDGKIFWLSDSCESEKRTLGKGCALSASAACHLAMGDSLYESVKEAKTYVNGAAMSCLELGKGRNPLNQTFIFDN